MIAPYPNPFQTSVTTKTERNHLLLAINKIGSIPNAPSTALIGPSYAKILTTTVAKITQERKFGRYTIVCMLLFMNLFLISFSSSANMIVTKVLRMILLTAIVIVLIKICLLSGIWNMNLKLSMPTQGDFKIPLAGI